MFEAIKLSQVLSKVFHIENTDVLKSQASHYWQYITRVWQFLSVILDLLLPAMGCDTWQNKRENGVGIPRSYGNIFNEESGFCATCLSDSFSVHEWKVPRCSPYISVCNSDDTSLFQLLITYPTFHNIRWQEEGYPHPDGLTVIPLDINLHWQKDNSNHIHLISLDRFRTCFSLPQ